MSAEYRSHGPVGSQRGSWNFLNFTPLAGRRAPIDNPKAYAIAEGWICNLSPFAGNLGSLVHGPALIKVRVHVLIAMLLGC